MKHLSKFNESFKYGKFDTSGYTKHMFDISYENVITLDEYHGLFIEILDLTSSDEIGIRVNRNLVSTTEGAEAITRNDPTMDTKLYQSFLFNERGFSLTNSTPYTRDINILEKCFVVDFVQIRNVTKQDNLSITKLIKKLRSADNVVNCEFEHNSEVDLDNDTFCWIYVSYSNAKIKINIESQ